MKIKVKYSSTQKFIIQLEDRNFGNLKNEIRKFVEKTYGKTVSEPLTLSLNGSDPLLGSDDTSLASLGIVPGDMLSILPPSSTSSGSSSSQPSATSSVADSVASSIVQRRDSELPKEVTPTENPKGNTDKNSGKLSLLEVKDDYPSPTLENLFSQCSPSTASQAVNLIVHLTMLECGFHVENNLEVPQGWKEMVATFNYCHNSFPEFKCTLALVTMGEVKQVLASFPQQESTISVQVKVGEYVKKSSKSAIPATDLVRVAQLSRILRDQVLHPLQVAAHQALGVPAPWHLAGLPHEILLIIASSLNARSVLNMGQSCRRLHSAMQDNKLWQKLYKRDFRGLYDSVTNLNLVDWKAKYREAMERVKEWERLHDEGMEFVIPGMLPPRPPFGPPNPSMPFPDFPRPRGDNPYPPQPHPTPNPFFDPDSPYFGGEIPQVPNPFPNMPDPLDPFGMLPRRPGRGGSFQPPFMPPTHPRNPRGPRFDFF